MDDSPSEITDSNKRLSLTLPLPQGGVYVAGQPLLPTVRILQYDAKLEALEVGLIAKVQVDVGTRDSQGNVIYDHRELWRREAVFIAPLVDPTTYGGDKKEKPRTLEPTRQSDGPVEGTWRVDIPLDQQVPHSSVWRYPQSDGFQAPYLITYRLELRGRRSGFFHKDERLYVKVPVGTPPPRQEVPTHTALSHPLKFRETDGSNLMADLHFSLRPPVHRSAQIPLRLSLTAASPHARQLLTAQPDNVATFKVKYGLHRTIHTYRPGGRKGLSNRQRRILKGHAELRGLSTDGELVWEGMVQVPDGYGTIACEWVSEDYHIDIQVEADVFVKDANREKTPVLSIPVFLPSV
ncbi:hypothetical protein JCM11251_005739 [Rhodosporidiobolus azoricus]